MRPIHQEQYHKMNIVKNPNQRNNINQANQSNTYKSNPNQQSSNKKDTIYISGRTIQPADLKKNSINGPNNISIQQSSSIPQQGNQRYIQQNIAPRIEKKIYVYKGRGADGDKNKIKNGLSSLVSSGESYTNPNNVTKSNGDYISRNKIIEDNKYGRKPLDRGNENRNLRERKIEKGLDHNRAKSYLSERKPANKLPLQINTLIGKNLPKSVEIKRKTIYRGGEYNNIQITHIISSLNPNNKYQFHIFEKLSRAELDKKPLDLNKIRSQIRRDDKAKSSFRSSCDGRIIAPISRANIQKTTIYQHAAGIGMTNLAPNMINSTYYKSGILKIPKKKREKKAPVVQIIEVFRSQQNSNDRNNNKSMGTKHNTVNAFNKTYINPNNVISRNTKEFQGLNNNNQNFKENIEKNQKSNINTYTRGSNISKNNYYTNLQSNTNKNNIINIKKNNIITVNKINNRDTITSSYNINQSNYDKDSNYSSNKIDYNQGNINNLTKSDLINSAQKSSISLNDDKNCLSDRREEKPIISSNVYTRTEPREEGKIFLDKEKPYSSNYYQRNISPKNERTQNTINSNISYQNTDKNHYNTNPANNIQNRNSLPVYPKNDNSRGSNISQPIYDRNSYNKTININRGSNQTSIRPNQQSPPKMKINLNEDNKNTPLKTDINNNYNRTTPTTNNYNRNIKKSPPKSNINTPNNAYQNSINKISIPSEIKRNSNFKINRQSPPKDLNNRYNINQHTDNKDNKILPPKIEINLEQKKIEDNKMNQPNINIQSNNRYNRNYQISNQRPISKNDNKVLENLNPSISRPENKPETKTENKPNYYPVRPSKDNNQNQPINKNIPNKNYSQTNKYIRPSKELEPNRQPNSNIESKPSENKKLNEKIITNQPRIYERPTRKIENNQPHKSIDLPINAVQKEHIDYPKPTEKKDTKQPINNVDNVDKNEKIDNKQPISYTRPTEKIEKYRQEKRDVQQPIKYTRPNVKVDNKEIINKDINPTKNLENEHPNQNVKSIEKTENNKIETHINPSNEIKTKQEDNKNKIDYKKPEEKSINIPDKKKEDINIGQRTIKDIITSNAPSNMPESISNNLDKNTESIPSSNIIPNSKN